MIAESFKVSSYSAQDVARNILLLNLVIYFIVDKYFYLCEIN